MLSTTQRLATLGLICLTSACVVDPRDEAARYYGDITYPEREPSEVEILQKPPKSDYIVIADIQARQVSAEHMQRRAAKIGADAVIIVLAGGGYSYSEVWVGADHGSNTYNRVLATCIVYKN